MDGAVGRVSLRGMGLLHGGRERRERDARMEVARRLDAARQAAATVERAQDAVERQRCAWREREHDALLAMHGAEASSNQLTAHWVEMDRLADEAVRLQAERHAAAVQQARAEHDVVEARGMLKRATRLAQRSEAVIGRIRHWRNRAAEAAEQTEGEDDAIRRHMAGHGR